MLPIRTSPAVGSARNLDRMMELIKYSRSAIEKCPAASGRGDSLGLAIEQGRAYSTFEFGNRTRYRGLRSIEERSGPPHATVLCDSHQNMKVVKLHSARTPRRRWMYVRSSPYSVVWDRHPARHKVPKTRHQKNITRPNGGHCYSAKNAQDLSVQGQYSSDKPNGGERCPSHEGRVRTDRLPQRACNQARQQ